MNFSRYILPILFLFNFYSTSFAQITRVSGKVYDSSTKEPLPFVNVLLKGTQIGTTTNFDGYYSLTTDKQVDSIVVSYIGYRKISRKVIMNKTQVINIEMFTNETALKEVVIDAGENPANVLFRKLVAKKKLNDKEKLDAFQYEVYNKIEFDINNIPEKFKKRKTFKPFSFILDNIDSTAVNEKPFLPLMITESLSDFYFLKKPRKQREIIKASRVAGVENKSVLQFMGDMYQKVNIYDNNILVFGKNFVSPISDNGLWYYKYYLVDSMYIDSIWTYQMKFKPKRKQELTFSGNFWVADKDYAVKRLEMSIANDANINFVNNLNVIQDYVKVDSAWMLSKDRLVIDFTYKDHAMGVYGRKTTTYRKFIINRPQTDSVYATNGENLIVAEDADKKTETYWQASRHDTLSKNEESIYKLVDTIQSLPVYKTYVDIISTMVTGYYVIKKVEFGPYFSTISFNDVEGTRLRVGGRTSNDFSRWVEFNGYSAYGTKDDKFKYGVGFKTFVTKKPRQITGITYKHDYEVLGQSQSAYRTDNIFTSLFRRNPLSNLTDVEHYNGYYEREWFTGFSSRLDLTHRIITPLSDTTYRYLSDQNILQTKNNIQTSEIGIGTRIAYDEKYVSGEFTRVSLGTKYPIFSLQFNLGVKGLLGSDYMYQKFKIDVDDRIRINPLGYFDYFAEYGKIFGKVPYPLLELHPGNETFVYDSYSFNLMNYYEFTSDEYFSFHVKHHFEGFFLNKIPLLRKLKWREVAMVKGVIGKVSDENKKELIFPATLSTLSKPYMEASIGVENIFKVLKVDAIWRLAYIDDEYVNDYETKSKSDIAKFGIRVSLQVIF